MDWASASESFREIIKKECVVVLSKSEEKPDKNNKWSTMSLGDCAIVSHQTILPSDAVGLPYIGLEHIAKDQMHLIGTGKPSDVSSVKIRFDCKDILFGKLRPYFRKIIMAPFEGICSTDIWVIRSREGVDQSFLFYCLASQSFIDFATRSSDGTRMPRAKWGYVSQYKIQIPSLSEQLAIAHVLESLDNKIELNRRMSETLEEMAQALFKSWFIDFDPVRAKMERCWRRGESLPGLPADLWELFPDRFVDSEIGRIPEGWNIGSLGSILKQRVERCHASEKTSLLPYVPIDCILPKSLSLTQSKHGSKAKSSLVKFYKGDLIFGAMRPYYHKVCIAPFEGTTRTTAFVLYPKQKYSFAFATLLLHNKDTINFATQNSTGSTIPYAVWNNSLESMPIVIPTENALEAFNNLVQPSLKHISQSYFEFQNLATLRDTILPKLISGKIRVS